MISVAANMIILQLVDFFDIIHRYFRDIFIIDVDYHIPLRLFLKLHIFLIMKQLLLFCRKICFTPTLVFHPKWFPKLSMTLSRSLTSLTSQKKSNCSSILKKTIAGICERKRDCIVRRHTSLSLFCHWTFPFVASIFRLISTDC